MVVFSVKQTTDLYLNSASGPRSEAGEAGTKARRQAVSSAGAAGCVEHENREVNTAYVPESAAESRITCRIQVILLGRLYFLYFVLSACQ